MRYYVTADIHGYYSELREALEEKGFFNDKEPHKLVICGDLFDRGSEAFEVQEFILELLKNNEIILIRGNHEDLALDLLNGWNDKSYLQRNHNSNGTVDTVLQLTKLTVSELFSDAVKVGNAFFVSPFIQNIIPVMKDFYETDNYIFVHGWIPCTPLCFYKKEYVPVDDWRCAGSKAWDDARWINGMEAAHCGVIERDKTIVCGHWHTSFGHSRYENDGGEFNNSPNFEPYYGDGIIALDACTPISGRVNCIVIED